MLMELVELMGLLGSKATLKFISSTGEYFAVQVEGLHVVPFTPATPADDQQLFYATHWINAKPNVEHSRGIPSNGRKKKSLQSSSSAVANFIDAS